MDVTDPTCIQSSSHSVMAGLSLFSLHIYVRAIHLDISPLTVPPGSVPARHFSLHRCTYLHTLKQLSGKCIVFIYKLYLQKCILVLVNITQIHIGHSQSMSQFVAAKCLTAEYLVKFVAMELVIAEN